MFSHDELRALCGIALHDPSCDSKQFRALATATLALLDEVQSMINSARMGRLRELEAQLRQEQEHNLDLTTRLNEEEAQEESVDE